MLQFISCVDKPVHKRITFDLTIQQTGKKLQVSPTGVGQIGNRMCEGAGFLAVTCA